MNSDLIAERKALTDIIERQKKLLKKLSKDDLILKIAENTINLSKATQFMLALKSRLKIDMDEVNEVLAFCLLRDFSKDKLLVLTRSVEKPYPKHEPSEALTTLKSPPDFQTHVKEQARKG